VIVLGSHMDSWDLGTGAIDDGAGGAITLGAAKAIAESGRRPARTVRVVLYGSEEVAQPTDTGNGGGAYLRGIGAAVEKHIIAGESDFGADRVYALGLPPGAQTRISPGSPRASCIRSAFCLRRSRNCTAGPTWARWPEAGVPVFGLSQDGTRYFDLHHTADDTLDKIDPKQMSQNVAAWAALVWLIADSDVDFRAMRPAEAAAH
jgi:carboxypeptidase Q